MDSSDDENGMLGSGGQESPGQSDEAVFTSPATLALLNSASDPRGYHFLVVSLTRPSQESIICNGLGIFRKA